MPVVKAGTAPLGAILLLLACSPATPAARSLGAPESAASASVLSPADTGSGPRICVHDAKDLTPCVEDCDRGIVSGCAAVASRAERARDLPHAVRHYERACELHDAALCVSAARMVGSGAGVPPDRTRQLELLAAACLLGDALACDVLAKAYASGNGVARDERRATELWARACTSGVPAACDAIDAGE